MLKNKPKIIITGASGFIGMSLFLHLRNMDPLGIRFSSNIKNITGNIHKLDLRDENHVKALFEAYSPTIVFHCAAMTDPMINEENKYLATEMNFKVTKNIIDNISHDSHLIFLSTDKVFDGREAYPTEESETNPQWLYGKLKLECENLIINRLEKYHILRLPIVHSYGDEHSKSFIDKALIDLRAGKRVEAFDNVKRCFVKLNELVDLLGKLLCDKHYGIYHVGSEMVSYYERILVLCKNNNVSCEETLIPKSGKAKPMIQNLDTMKLKTTFNICLN